MDSGTELIFFESTVAIKRLDVHVSREPKAVTGQLLKGNRKLGISIAQVESVAENTKVTFQITDSIDIADFLKYEAEYAGHHLVRGQHTKAELEDAREKALSAAMPYISEIVAYISGRCGISPIILPPQLPAKAGPQVEAEKEGANES